MKHITRIGPADESFNHNKIDYDVTHVNRKDMTVWTLYKLFNRSVEYRVLSDVALNTPIAIQRLKCFKKAS